MMEDKEKDLETEKKIVCLNLGCGFYTANSMEPDQIWFNLDLAKNHWVDLVANLEDGLPFKDESADLLYASHVVEHVRKFPELMKEFHRVLKPRGILHIIVPMSGCRAAIADPTHVHQFAPETWTFFDMKSVTGFDTLGMQKMGFWLKWNEVIKWSRPGIDDGTPGGFFTENIVEFEKVGPMYEWEEYLTELAEKGKADEKKEESYSI